MDGKARYIFPVLITAIVVFVASAVVTWHNIGFRADYVVRWLSAFLSAGRWRPRPPISPFHPFAVPPSGWLA